MTRKHSVIGASSAYRWTACPGSVRMSKDKPNKSSVYAAEGTMMHQVAEGILLAPAGNAHDYVGNEFEVEGFTFEFNEDHAEAVQTYVDYVRDLTGQGYEVEIEQKLDLSHLHPGMFGTSDCTAYHPRLRIIKAVDFKGGSGIAVEPEQNAQGLFYTLGAVHKLGNRGISEVHVVIVQPRAPHPNGPIREWKTDPVTLAEHSFALIDAAKRTEDPDAPLVAGDHCKFCPAAATCPELERVSYEAAAAAFTNDGTVIVEDPQKYDPATLAKRLENVDILEDYCRRLREFAHHEAEAGRTPPGFKLVATRATRKWKSELDAKAALEQYGLDEDDMYTKKFVSPAGAEKVVGKKDFREFTDLVEKKSSGTVLAPIDDPRPEMKPDIEGVFDSV